MNDLFGTKRTDPRPWVGFSVVLALVMLVGPASAEEWSGRGDDLQLSGDSRWVGGGWGGYQPIRLEITNFGPARQVEARFKPNDEGLPTVRRRVVLAQNATARLSLPVPLVGETTYGMFSLLSEGLPVDGLSRSLTVTAAEDGVPRPALLIVADGQPDVMPYTAAVRAMAQPLTTGSYRRRGSSSGLEVEAQAVPASALPAGWVNYVGVDLVAVRLATFASLPADRQAGLLDWAAAGGRLVIHNVGGSAATSDDLARILGPAGADRAAWQDADAAGRRQITLVETEESSSDHATPNEGDPGGDQNVEERLTAEPTWATGTVPFAVRRHGFGRIAAVRSDLFAGDEAAYAGDWAWLLGELGGLAVISPVRFGLDARTGGPDFLSFPIPGVTGVPVISFLTLITLFTLVIGPLNYILLARRNQLARLVVTVPILAAVTTVVLFSYSMVAHGFSTKGRVRSVTLIDPQSRTATTLARMAVFSGLAPSRGLVFSAATAALPIHPPWETFGTGTADWTDAQQLSGGWLPSRTRTQFLTITRRDERGRLTVTPAGSAFKAANGFAVPLSHLIVTGPDGRPWAARDVPAGGEATLHPLTDDDWAALRTLANDRQPATPDGVDPNDLPRSPGRYRWRNREWEPQPGSGLLERHLSLLTGLPPRQTPAEQEEPLPFDAAVDRAAREDKRNPLAGPRGFLAVAAENPGVDLGGLTVDERGSLHVLMGGW